MSHAIFGKYYSKSNSLFIWNWNLTDVCHILIAYVLTHKFICWNPNVMLLGGGALRRCLSHKGEALMNGISGLIKDTSERSLTSSTMQRHSQKTLFMNQVAGPQSVVLSYSSSNRWSQHPIYLPGKLILGQFHSGDLTISHAGRILWSYFNF